MFVCNLKVNAKRIKKILFIIGLILFVLVIIFVCTKIFHTDFFFNKDSSCSMDNTICEITNDNYTDVLKTVHEHLDDYIGQSVRYSGYVYRLSDFNEKNFVLARNMVISSDFQSVVVGFLCECDTAYQYKDFSWVEIEGTIVKGDYHGEIPVLRIHSIRETKKPNEEYVYPPSDAFIPTSTIL